MAQEHQKATENNCGGWRKNYFPGKEKLLYNSQSDQEQPPTVKGKRLHQSKYIGFTTRWKPLVSE